MEHRPEVTKRKERRNEETNEKIRNEIENDVPRAKEPRALVQKVRPLQTSFTNYFVSVRLPLLHPNLTILTFGVVLVSVSVGVCERAQTGVDLGASRFGLDFVTVVEREGGTR